MSNPVITLLSDQGNRGLSFDGAADLLSLFRAEGVYLPAICGGRGTCGKCKIKVISGTLEPSPADRSLFSPAELAAGFRLACTARPGEDLSILMPRTGEDEFAAVSGFESADTVINNLRAETFLPEKNPLSFARQADGPNRGRVSLHALRQIAKLAEAAADLSRAGPGEPVQVYRERGEILYISKSPRDLYAIGIDIGTTTIALALINLQTGKIRDRLSVVNRQREFGGDVISRIQRANGGDLALLSKTVRRQISEGIAALCRDNALGPGELCKIALAGNTTMIHLLLGLSCAMLGKFPFTPVTLDFVSCGFSDLFEGDWSCGVDVLPGISTYVGADIVSGILFSGLYQSPDPVVLMDIGTNGEMALAESGSILCTATAAGPAFEGGNILWGTGSVPGAIASVSYRDGAFAVGTIGDRPPVGICGSGVVDTVYEGLQNGLILSGGGFNKDRGIEALVLAKTPEGEDIQFCQRDVRELQLAKSAVRSGIEALLNNAGLDCDAIKTLYIAGGFGYNLNFTSGAGIGLIPEALKPKVALIGNSSLGGTVKYLLNPDYRALLNTIVDHSREFALSTDPYFNENFVENMEFPVPEFSSHF
jgi:uncharacterized 2Fe-2S/4Fe-4S cluster protein (DUF4445 family)